MNLVRLRNERGWSQSVLADKIVEAGLLPKLSDGAVKMWETGERNPGPKSTKALLAIFEVTRSELFDDPVDRPAPNKEDRASLIGEINVMLMGMSENEIRMIRNLIRDRRPQEMAKLKV